ncbi:hypothetical protein RhiirB3_436888 [Rhizophagus irregularis]|nr:hypothetical protein RhiirB3_436888 [Rhizophagus irregularis]
MSLEDNYVFVNGKSVPFADAYLTQSKDIIGFGFDFISIQKINYECKKNNNDAVNDAKQKKMKVLNDFLITKNNFGQYFGDFLSSRLAFFFMLYNFNPNFAKADQIANMFKGIGETISSQIFRKRPYYDADNLIDKNKNYSSVKKVKLELEKCSYMVVELELGRLSDLNFGLELWNGTVHGLEFWSGTLEWNNPGCYGMTSQGKPSSQLIIPLSNATVERIFLHQNLIKTKSRNKLCTKNLNRQLMILINGPDIEDFDFDKAYDNWINLKARRMQNSKNFAVSIVVALLKDLTGVVACHNFNKGSDRGMEPIFRDQRIPESG